MTIAITDWQRYGRRPAHAADAVRTKLSALESGDTRVLHSVGVGSAECEIDHLVISPSGVFAVTVREQHGRDVFVADYAMSVGGTGVPYLRQSKFEAERVARLIASHVDFEVPVRGCVVLLTGSFTPHVEYDSRPIGVSVLTKHDVPRWFRRQPAVLQAGQVAAIYAVISSPSLSDKIISITSDRA